MYEIDGDSPGFKREMQMSTRNKDLDEETDEVSTRLSYPGGTLTRHFALEVGHRSRDAWGPF